MMVVVMMMVVSAILGRELFLINGNRHSFS